MAVIKDCNLSDEVEEEEPGEVIESAPPLKVGEEREINTSLGLKKKLVKQGHGFETPQFGDEVTVHYVSRRMDGNKLDYSTRDKGIPISFTLGDGQVMYGLDYGIVTMKRGEVALFTLPSGTVGADDVSPDFNIQFEVELLSWIVVVDICKDGGIIKKVLSRGERNEQPGDLDEVTVKYQVMLDDGTVIAKTPEEGVEFYVKDGHFCPGLPKALKTMKRGDQVKLIIQPQYAFGEHKLTADNRFSIIPVNSVLSFDLELVSFKPVIDVTGDTKVLKKILKEGEGSHVAEEGSTVFIKYTARLEDGTIFEKIGSDENEPLKFVVDEEQVVAGLDRAVATMKKGELASVTVQPGYGYGSTEVKRELAAIPPSSILVYEIEMVDFKKEKSPWEMNSRRRLRQQ
ncbi:hypothetical protein AQUCO_06000064v1 [Aquilegia coerulea]|uniref:peptidylprolyl isomerase n=1 Tax=Aquilegia coerulea TaxID=218851 RepID=A0A2G5CDV0_AQUCA|nr:hypothetical protein AQUCO_06000064v1 [Aquilegia coerulea]